MVTRRSHKKSRAGCEQCKQRKIKCDESLPSCHGCVKRELTCNYGTRSATSRGGSSVHVTIDQDNSIPYHATELELLHHFTVWTYKTCDQGMMPSSWWQEVLPVMATQHDHLLYALLSFTSLHIAHLRPLEAARYAALAIDYRDRTLKILPAIFSDISCKQGDACFWSSVLIGMISLAMHHVTAHQSSSLKAVLLELSTLWKGAQTVGTLSAAVTGVDNLASYAHSSIATPTRLELRDKELEVIFDRVRECVRADGTFPDGMRDVYIDAIDELTLAFSVFESQGLSGRILAWFVCLDARIMEAIESEQTAANFILVFYGVVLKMVPNIWYIQDIGTKLVEELTPKIPLASKEMVKLVNWARESVCN